MNIYIYMVLWTIQSMDASHVSWFIAPSNHRYSHHKHKCWPVCKETYLSFRAPSGRILTYKMWKTN